jgi:hypothetical protein
MTGSDSLEFDDELVGKIVAELERVLGTKPDPRPGFSFELRITSSQDPIEFLRSIPSGTSREEIPALADAYARRSRFLPGSDVRHGAQAGSEYWVHLEIGTPRP